MTDNQTVLRYLSEHHGEMVALLTRLVELESPSLDKAAVDRLGAFLADELRDLGASVEILPQARVGDHVKAQWGQGPGGVLILCHMDTVWDVGTVTKCPVRVQEGKLFGPGAYDMKGGIANALWAMRALRALDLVPDLRITVLITSDEETGSETSRPIIEAAAQDHDVVFVLEPAQGPDGSYKTWRKGVGNFEVSVSGRASHAGGDHEKGINAIEELAHQILTIQGFTDYEVGTTFNVGVVEGGSRPNVVPAQATAQVDVRVMSAGEAGRVEEKMAGLQPQMPGTRVMVTGGVERPPMVRTPQVAALFEQARALAGEMGMELKEAGTGGASDGNFTAALGVPTLDGMGVVGDGAHATDEHVVLGSLPERAALLAAMLCTRAGQA